MAAERAATRRRASWQGASRRSTLVLHNQDNREHDLLDSDDYYQFEGGLAATVRHLSGRQPEVYHNDHSRPEFPRVRRSRRRSAGWCAAAPPTPKWIAGVMRHGYKGAFEIAATVDYLFAFAATAGVVEDHHFDALFDAYLADEAVRGFSPSTTRPPCARSPSASTRRSSAGSGAAPQQRRPDGRAPGGVQQTVR